MAALAGIEPASGVVSDLAQPLSAFVDRWGTAKE